MSVLSFENLTLGYDRHPAVHHLKTQIEPGSLTAVVGPNGAGKSTLFKGVTGVLSPLEGRVVLGSVAPADIGYLPQKADIDLSFPITVMDLVAMGLWREVGAFGRIGRKGKARVRAAIEAVGLSGLERRMIGSLSGGQLQRALFARLLLQDAKLVLLDEPFAAVDARTITDLLEVIKGWHQEGRTILAVLHDHDTVHNVFPETLLIARELVAHGPTNAVMTAENHARARALCEAVDPAPQICEVHAA